MAFSAAHLTQRLHYTGWHVLTTAGDQYCPALTNPPDVPPRTPAPRCALVLTKAAPVYMRVAQEERHGICVRLWEQLMQLSMQCPVAVYIWEAKAELIAVGDMRRLKTPVSMGPASGRFCSHGMAFFPRRLFTIQTPTEFLHIAAATTAPSPPPIQGQLL